MSDYFFQQPDEDEKAEAIRMELEWMKQQANAPQKSPPIFKSNGPVPIGGLTIQPEAREMSDEELRVLMEMLITGKQ